MQIRDGIIVLQRFPVGLGTENLLGFQNRWRVFHFLGLVLPVFIVKETPITDDRSGGRTATENAVT